MHVMILFSETLELKSYSLEYVYSAIQLISLIGASIYLNISHKLEQEVEFP